MPVVLKFDGGWFVDHQLSIDNSYEQTEIVDITNENLSEPERKKTEEEKITIPLNNKHCSAKFQCDPDLFAIWQPFLMDSQFSKLLSRQDSASYQLVNDQTIKSVKELPDRQNVEQHLFCKELKDDPDLKRGQDFSEIQTFKQEELCGKDFEYLMDGVLSSDTPKPLEVNCNKRKKRKRKHPLNVGEMALVEEHKRVSQILTAALRQLESVLSKTDYNMTVAIHDNNIAARQAAANSGLGDFFIQHCQESSNPNDLFQPMRMDDLSSGEDLCNKFIEHPHETAVMRELMGQWFLIPLNCRFLLSDFKHIESLLLDKTRYDCIVVDPPWENKSVKRKKTYDTLSDFDLLRLPLKLLCSRDALILVWVTNKQRQQRFVIENLFPAWNVRYLTKWYWLKVTKSLQPVCNLNSETSFKRPYECIILGSTSSELSQHTYVPQEQVIISIPCSIHSRKPPLNEIIQPYLIQDAKCLEMFARSLLPKWTSWGNEVLALQHLDFFQRCTCSASMHL